MYRVWYICGFRYPLVFLDCTLHGKVGNDWLYLTLLWWWKNWKIESMEDGFGIIFFSLITWSDWKNWRVSWYSFVSFSSFSYPLMFLQAWFLFSEIMWMLWERERKGGREWITMVCILGPSQSESAQEECPIPA
jgi:hypothetical protein